MNTNALKRFAQQTRTLLLEQVATRLHLVLKTDSVELRERAEQVAALRTALLTTTATELVDKVAYTWFNRLVALRYLDVNGYQPLGVRIVSPAEADETHPLPEVLQLAQQGIIDAELLPDQDRVMGLLRGTIPSQNVDNEVYRELLVGACNSLHTLFPFLFEPVQDHTELLLPADLTTVYSVVYKVRNELLAEDCQHVEVLGWLYQFYIAERKEAVFAAKTKFKKEDIPAATQLFTPRWIVEYMVQNTVGKLWLQHNPDSGLRQHMPYFIDSASLQASDKLSLSGPEELTVLDPACGSGHLLVYTFELLAHIYEEEGYNKADIPGLILTHNLWGLEIDERAAQLAGFALMMKARAYHSRAFRKALTPHITHLQPLALRKEQAQAVLAQVGQQGSLELWHDLDALGIADNIGSLLIPRTPVKELSRLKDLLDKTVDTVDMFRIDEREKLSRGLVTLIELSQKYTCVAANPPYMGSSNMNSELLSYVKKHYPKSKADLMACFMESSLAMLQPKGFLGMINQQSWMFVSSYEELREDLLDTVLFDTLLHLGPRTFPEIGGEKVQNASFTFWNNKPGNYYGYFVRLIDLDSSKAKKNKLINEIENKSSDYTYKSNQSSFKIIPGSPIGYWLTDDVKGTFKGTSVGDMFPVRKGNSTSDNNRFLRFWFETNLQKNAFGYDSVAKLNDDGKVWVPYNKGGGYRKWYGNHEYMVMWKDNGKAIRQIPTSVVTNEKFYMKPGLTWSTVSTGDFSLRSFDAGFIFDNGGCCLFIDNKESRSLIQGLMNSKVFKHIISGLNPTVNFQSGEVSKFPVLFPGSATEKEAFVSAVDACVEIARLDWDENEFSWDFKVSPILNHRAATLEQAFADEKSKLMGRLKALLISEYEIDKEAIKTYKLNGEIEPVMNLDGISICQGIISTNSFSGNFHIKDLDQRLAGVELNVKELVIYFISYAIGCMFGRYSLDKEGVIMAGQGQNVSDYLKLINKLKEESVFLPDSDNIIPLLDDEWFEDDVVTSFYHFLKQTFGEGSVNKNISFIEDVLGKNIRQYFTKDFYDDHIKIYSKRPIYWNFASPNRAFSVLVYMHRYTPDTINLVLNRYLRPLQVKITERIERLQSSQISASSSTAERARAAKEQDKLERQMRELQVYERDSLLPLATARITLDLDEGVLVNYNKFGKAVREITGLNDSKTKAKVRAFDWIDATQIR